MDARAVERLIYRHVNSERRRRGRDSLRFSRLCANKARAHAREMRRLNYFGHVSPSGQDWNGGGWTSECCAPLPEMGSESDASIAPAAVRAWRGSAPHHHAMLTASGFIGAGVSVNASGQVYAVIQMTWKPEHIERRTRSGKAAKGAAAAGVRHVVQPGRKRKRHLLRRLADAMFHRT